ncbi:hypothetical protein ACJJTC_019202 [Scirpophaga incertulas]
MKCISRLFQPLITIPKNAKIKNSEITCKSQKLLLELGLIKPTGSGLFSLLPLAKRAADKLEAVLCRHIEAVGGQRLSLPTLTASSLWEKTGRLNDVGPELITLEDRHEHKYLLAPTHEETIADLLADTALSYKQLPLLLYQISNKYRDELRPKHGLLRAREFLMLDAYGIHGSIECATQTYQRVTDAYSNAFKELQLPVLRVEAPTGDMGGSFSHEWQLCASAGEDVTSVCPSCSHAKLRDEDGDICETCNREMQAFNSIEVGHTFVLGTKYSAPLGAKLVPPSGAACAVVMTCFGIGVTRLLAASLEALSTDTSLRWPTTIAPYSVIIIGPKEGSNEWPHGWERVTDVYEELSKSAAFRDDVIVDDRHHLTIGKRLMMADRVGYPLIVVCGKSASTGKYEVYRNGNSQLMTLEELTEGEKRITNKI